MSEFDQDNAEIAGSDPEYLTIYIEGQLFGMSIEQVHDVFLIDGMTPVPLSIPEIAGVLNLRGRIVTAIDMRRRLNLPPKSDDSRIMAAGVEYRGESYGLIIDNVGEVLRFGEDQIEANPANLDARWRNVSSGVCRLENDLLVVLDVEKVLDFGQEQSVAA